VCKFLEEYYAFGKYNLRLCSTKEIKGKGKEGREWEGMEKIMKSTSPPLQSILEGIKDACLEGR
jgi:hypothetical protein